jgi:integrase
MTKNQLKEYLSQIRSKYSNSYYNVIGSALKILYSDVLKQPLKMEWFHPVKTEKKYVDIITYTEFVDMMKSTSQIKHKLIIILLYSTGVRLSELLNIELSDIKEDMIFIRTVKHGKNRYVQLHKLTKRYLNSYIRKWNPTKYLLEGQFKSKYSSSSVQNIIKRTSNGRFYPHLFRHTYLTNVIEKVDVFAAKELAGHMSLKSTMHYNHIPKERLVSMYNPLDVAM